MVKRRAEEVWAGACLELALPGVEVRHHDDGSRSSMYDLDLVHEGVLVGICEVTSATDGVATASWNRLTSSSNLLQIDGLRQGWLVEITPGTSKDNLAAKLPSLLRLLESHDPRVQESTHLPPSLLQADTLANLGVISLHPLPDSYPGHVHVSVFLTNERHGNHVPRSGDDLAKWLSDWLAKPEQGDNAPKLLRVAANERHIFVVFPDLSLAPFAVADVLCRANAPLPTIDLQVPEGITHVWAASTWSSGSVFAWESGVGWSRSPKPGPIRLGEE